MPAMNAASRSAAPAAPQWAVGVEDQRDRDRDLGERKRQADDAGCSLGDAEVRHRTPRAREIAQLADPCSEKDCRQHHP